MPRLQRTRRLTVAGSLVTMGVTFLTTFAGVVGVAQEPAPPASGGTPAEFVLATGPGMDEFQRACVLCHPADRIVSTRRTRTEWEEVIDQMVSRGAQVTDENYTQIHTYLLSNYGKVNVNRAVKDDLVLVIGLAPAEAESLVKFRGENGPFADFEALTRVPGIDAKKLALKKGALTF